MLKYVDQIGIEVLYGIIEEAWENKTVPEDWIRSLYKKYRKIENSNTRKNTRIAKLI